MGRSFSTLYIKNHSLETDTVCASLRDFMKKAGYRSVKNDSLATVTLKVVFGSKKWIAVYAKPPFFAEEEGARGALSGLSAALHTDILNIVCEDSDYLLLRILNSDRHTDNSIYFGDENGSQPAEDAFLSAWEPYVTDINLLKEIAARDYAAADDALFDFQQLFDLPDECCEESECGAVYLYFKIKQTQSKCGVEYTEEADIKKRLSDYLKHLGFSKIKKYFVKKICGELCLTVEIFRQSRAAYNSGPYMYVQTDLPLFDLRVAVTCLSSVSEDAFLNNSLNTLARVADRYRIAGLVNSPEEIAGGLIKDFEKYVYAPLFSEKDAFFGLFDYMCFIESRTRLSVMFDSYDKALAAYYENRFKEALLCVKRIFLNWIIEPRAREKITVTDAINLSVWDIEGLRQSEHYDGLQDIFELYDKICDAQAEFGIGLVPDK